MKKLKQLACGFLAAALLVCALPARAQATGENYVEVAMTISPEYEAQGPRCGRAHSGGETGNERTVCHAGHDAQAAFQKLYAPGEDGSYNGTKEDGDLNNYVNANPFYYRPSDQPSDIDKRPVQAVSLCARGTVPAGSGRDIQLGNGQAFVVNDVKLTGAGGAGAVTGGTAFYAKVAGGYEGTFVESGTFTVRGVDFSKRQPCGQYQYFGRRHKL